MFPTFSGMLDASHKMVCADPSKYEEVHKLAKDMNIGLYCSHYS